MGVAANALNAKKACLFFFILRCNLWFSKKKQINARKELYNQARFQIFKIRQPLHFVNGFISLQKSYLYIRIKRYSYVICKFRLQVFCFVIINDMNNNNVLNISNK